MKKKAKTFRNVAEVREHYEIPTPPHAWETIIRAARSQPDQVGVRISQQQSSSHNRKSTS